MPEGPELHTAARLVNRVSEGRIYSGKVLKSEVSTKNPDIPWDEPAYIISATARGKEVRLTLSVPDQLPRDKKGRPKKKNISKNEPETKKTDPINILFRFGMSGKFLFKPKSEMEKHNHLNFFSRDDDMVLSFNDYRRFGRWEITDEWGKDRGPCIILEYDLFRSNVLKNLQDVAFNKPICEALLNQKFFNGTGNYLRAEILYRLRIPPFALARSVLEPIREAEELGVKSEADDLLKLCNLLPLEVLNLNEGKGNIYDPRGDAEGFSVFMSWLQCYYKDGMTNLVDHNGRTIWFTGPAGPLKPKDTKTRGKVARAKKSTKRTKEEDDAEDPPNSKKVRKVKKDDPNMDETPKQSSAKARKGRAKSVSSSIKTTPSVKTEPVPATPKTLTPRRTTKQKKQIRGTRMQPSRSCRGTKQSV